MLLLAHRGCPVDAPENTLAAFEAAVALGVDGIETDVRLSADGELVLLHDRVTPQGHPVAAMTRAALERELGYRVPVLTDAIDAFPDVLWNIEIKVSAAAGRAVATLQQYRRSHRLLVTSFRHDVIAWYAAKLEVEWGLLFAHLPTDTRAIMNAAGSRIRNAVWDYGIIEAQALQDFVAAGWSNYVYGTATSAERQQCAAFAVAGIIVDCPLNA